jgi:hypothetical protein
MPALTAAVDWIRASDAALDRYEKAQTSRNAAELAKARKDLERIRGELEKFRDPNAEAFRLIKRSLERPIDLLAKGEPIRKSAATVRSDRFDKLMRPAGGTALAK